MAGQNLCKVFQTSKEVLLEIEREYNTFIYNADRFKAGVKIAGRRARACSLKLDKLLKKYRALTISEEKVDPVLGF
jgi:hypothetical protein